MMKLLEATEDDRTGPPDLAQVHVGSESRDSREKDGLDHVNEDRLASFYSEGIYTKYYPTPEEVETYEPEFVCCRRRMRTRPLENPSSTEEYETAMIVPGVGLVGEAKFWHQYDNTTKVIREDRAILFQSEENYEKLINHEEFYWCFEDFDYDYMKNPTFGEQVIVSGIDTSILAIGDVFEIEGGHSPLVVEITAPRIPCSLMNWKHGTENGTKGIQHFLHHNNLAGWFARVLVAGELREGMKFIRKSHPNPKWTLDYIHKALYGEGTSKESSMRVASWNRDREELEELIALPQLGEYEWKVEARKRLLKLDGFDWKTVDKHLIDPQLGAPRYFKSLVDPLYGIFSAILPSRKKIS